MLKMTDVDLKNKRVLIREDLNVPIENGHITSDARIVAALPAIDYAVKAGAAVMIMAHLGRPTEGEYDSAFSLEPIAHRLEALLGQSVRFQKNWLEGIAIKPGEIVLLENVRFNLGEKKNDETLARRMAALCDVFVMDAFGTAHRAEASTAGIAHYAAVACAGPLLVSEIEALDKVLKNPARPLIAIVGGSKVSSKLLVLKALSEKVDQLILGGGIANTFIAAAGYSIGKSLYEPEFIDQAKALMATTSIPIPVDVVVATKFAADAEAIIKPVENIGEEDLILDIGPETAQRFVQAIKQAGTVLWNGPVGVFEWPQFAGGTRVLADAIAESAAFSVAGGGDTLAAIEQFGISDKLSYTSTGGGAFLEFVEGKKLPGIEALCQS